MVYVVLLISCGVLQSKLYHQLSHIHSYTFNPTTAIPHPASISSCTDIYNLLSFKDNLTTIVLAHGVHWGEGGGGRVSMAGRNRQSVLCFLQLGSEGAARWGGGGGPR